MKNEETDNADAQSIREILHWWRDATRAGRKDDVLADFAEDALVYDPIPPFKYDSAAAYRRSFDQWWPDGEAMESGKFDLLDLKITAGEIVAFAHGVIRCGGTLPGGEEFEDLVRLTVCLRKFSERWMIVHYHASMPRDGGGDET